MENTDKSAEDDFIAMVIAQEVAKYKAVIEKLLPLAEKNVYLLTGSDSTQNKHVKSIIEEVNNLLKLTPGNDPQTDADRD